MENKKIIFILIVVFLLASLGYGVFRMLNKSSEDVPLPQGKLNIDVVCEGALAYMTFPDAKSAETFVSECKEGKHPEVIERYKAEMNLGDGATI